MSIDSDPSHTAATSADDLDQAPDDVLLGVPLRDFLQVRAIRGLALVLVAGIILLWPDRSQRVLAVLFAAGLVLHAITTGVEVVRHRDRRRFPLVLSVGVAAGLAAALLAHPDESLTSATQAVGGMLIAAALATVGLVLARRQPLVWGLTKATGLAVVGGMLVAYPDTLLVAAISVSAGAAAAIGLIEVFTPEEPDPGSEAENQRSPTTVALRRWVQRRPPEAEERSALQDKVYFEGDNSAMRFTRFVTLMLFASVLASVGVVVDSTAVVIGAMLIAPLMVPLMGTAYGATMGWLRRTRRCAGITIVGIAVGIVTGALIGSIVPRAVDVNENVQILARVAPTTLDLAIAVAAGAAGAYALTRRDVSDSLPGVAIAISLVPPLTVVGLCWQQGAWSAGNGALLLFLTNATAILVAGGATFVVVGAAPLDRISEGQERRATVIVSIVSLAGVVVALLLLNGASLAQRDLTQGAIEDVLTAWTEENPDHRLLDIRTWDDGTLVIDLAGPGELPLLDELLEDLDDALPEDMTVRVTWIEQEQVILNGD